MANHFYANIEILPAKPRVDAEGNTIHGIKRSALEHIKKNNLPFVVETNRADLADGHKKHWQITKITSYCELRKGYTLQGIKWFNDEGDQPVFELFEFFNDAVVKQATQVEGHDVLQGFLIIKDGELSYESGFYSDEDVYSSVEHAPADYKEDHEWGNDDDVDFNNMFDGVESPFTDAPKPW